MEIPYAADPFSHLTPGLAPGCFYTVGGTRKRETGWLQNCLLIIDFERASCEVLAQDTFLLQIKPEEVASIFSTPTRRSEKLANDPLAPGGIFFRSVFSAGVCPVSCEKKSIP